MAGKEIGLILAWDADVDLRMWIYSAPDNPRYGFVYLAQAPTYTWTETRHARATAATYLPGKYLVGVERTTSTPVATQYGVFALAYDP
jgi:hypothetical protein